MLGSLIAPCHGIYFCSSVKGPVGSGCFCSLVIVNSPARGSAGISLRQEFCLFLDIFNFLMLFIGYLNCVGSIFPQLPLGGSNPCRNFPEALIRETTEEISLIKHVRLQCLCWIPVSLSQQHGNFCEILSNCILSWVFIIRLSQAPGLPVSWTQFHY